MPSERILIVGAGPTGLMLAIELARLGVHARIVEKRREPTATSRALGVFARTLELFDRAGVIDEVLAAGRRLGGAIIHAGGKELARLSTDSLDSPYPFILSIPQSQTERILETRLRELGVTVERETTLTSLSVAGDTVTAHLERDDGTRASATFDWVVGCDGAHSTVREQIGMRFEGADLHQSFVFADASVDWDLSEERVNLFFSAMGVVAAVPLPEPGRWRVIVSLPQGESQPSDPTLAMIEERMRARIERPVSLHEATWVTGFEVRQRKVERFRQGRVLLAGDAAHAHSPVGGQGMNTGLQDASNLAWKLAMVRRGAASEKLLDTYDEEREPIARELLRGTGLATRIVTLQSSLAQSIRNAVAQFLLGFDAVQDRLVKTASEVRIGYRGCALSGDADSSGALRAGDRAPDSQLTLWEGRTARLFELLREPGFHVLVHGARDKAAGERFIADVRHHVQSLAIPLFTHFVRSSERSEYASEEASVMLIRPDGYIGLRSRLNAAAIPEYVECLRNPAVRSGAVRAM